MAKGRVHLGSKNFFTLVVLSVSVLGLMFVTQAAQQRTSTESDAARGCTSKAPLLKPIDTTRSKNYVVYKYTITNLCNTKYSYGFQMGAPGSWIIDYRENLDYWQSYIPFLAGSIKAKDTVTVRARVFPINAASKTYKFQAKACNAYGLGDAPLLGSNCITSSVSYTVTNN